jgi:hypothetical protein
MNVARYGDRFERRTDPWGRDYYWLTGGPPENTVAHETDLSALAKGYITLTPLDYDLTRKAMLAEMQGWEFRLESVEAASDEGATVHGDLNRRRRPAVMAKAGNTLTAPNHQEG